MIAENESPNVPDQLLEMNIMIQSLKSFQFSPDEIYDYTSLFEMIQAGLIRVVKYDSFVIYMADKVKNTFWTKKTDEFVTSPIIPDSLCGLVYNNLEPIL